MYQLKHQMNMNIYVDWVILTYLLSTGKNELHSSNITSQSMFCDVINQFSFQQLNTVPSNVKGNMLDLVFTNAPKLFSSINEYPVDISSDHKALY